MIFKRLKNIWLSTSLKKKLGIYTAVVVLVMGLSAAFNINLMNYALDSFNVILKDNSRCHEVQNALIEEARAFESYAMERNKDNQSRFEEACEYTRHCISLLPSSYRAIGAERVARTWNIRNAYEGYSEARDEVLAMNPSASEFVPELYKVYTMQDYLQTYARRLLQTTMLDGNRKYQARTYFYQNVPRLILTVSAAFAMLILFINRIVTHAWLNPLQKLLKSIRKIAVNDYSGEDVVVDSRDEMGEMVQAFNKMKHATKGYIDSLMDNYEMSERLHKEELERMQTEKRLENARMELLKSQINPHFLFNTLNTISCMAKLEDAATTDRMITSMSNLFRYNLKTSEQIVLLAQELKVVEDYCYIQKMRFGSRICFRMLIDASPDDVSLPAFTLQPLVENAFIHGLSKKVDGGSITIHCRMQKEDLVVSVADTGLGITEERLKAVRQSLENSEGSGAGIGLGNINKRIHTLYPEGELHIYSREKHGTVILLKIPQKGKRNDSNTDC